jgi:DNA polymerase III delta prime subunit
MKTHSSTNVPWIEKYRPTKFETIVLDPINRKLFKNIIDQKHFPNLLFYGPPGTGKTTTVINLINEFQEKHNIGMKGSLIHLNASDERGVDVIRNHINQFVKSKSLFENGYKFVILDEVDYMTKNAQQALKYLLQNSLENVHFCLICNYISKIDESLQNEFICIRFNQLPKKDIHSFIKNISEKENIGLSDHHINTIQTIYNSDIRSMINFIQLNQHWKMDGSPFQNEWENILSESVWETLYLMLIDLTISNDVIVNHIHNISIQYNIDKKHVLQTYFNYIIRYHPDIKDSSQRIAGDGRSSNGGRLSEYLNFIKDILHNNDVKTDIFIKYFVQGRCEFL